MLPSCFIPLQVTVPRIQIYALVCRLAIFIFITNVHTTQLYNRTQTLPKREAFCIYTHSKHPSYPKAVRSQNPECLHWLVRQYDRWRHFPESSYSKSDIHACVLSCHHRIGCWPFGNFVAPQLHLQCVTAAEQLPYRPNRCDSMMNGAI